jgi:hypothetical protein
MTNLFRVGFGVALVLAACTTSPPALPTTVPPVSTPTAALAPTSDSVVSPARELALRQYLRLDPTADPRGGSAVYVVDSPDIQVDVSAPGAARVEVVLSLGAAINAAKAFATPDTSGTATAALQLPERRTIYIVQAYVVPVDQERVLSIVGESFRVMYAPQ